MVFKHTAKYWRTKYTAKRVRPRATRNFSWKNFSRKPVLDRLLKTIFSSSFSHIDGSFIDANINFLAFSYYYGKKLIFSISRNDGMTDVYEVSEEKEIILNLRSLSEKRTPQWILSNFDHLQYGLNSEFCLTNISFIDCENTASVFCYLSNLQVNNKEIPMKTTKNVSPNGDQNAIHPSLVPLQQISSPDNDNPNPPIMANQVSNINHIQELEKYLRCFLKWCKVNNGCFLLHHVKDEKMHSTVYTVFAENNQLSGYLFNDDGETNRITQCLMNHDMSEFSHLKINEFSMENLELLNNYIIHLVKNTLENSAQLQLMYRYPSYGKVETTEMCIINWMKDNENEHVLIKEQSRFLEPSCSKSLRIDDISLLRRDLCTVYGKNWLNDTIIDAYLNLIAMRSQMYPGALPSVYVFSSYFFKCYSSQKKSRRIMRSARRILQSDILFFPINPGNHWTLLCADNRRRTLLHYDSLRGMPPPLQVFHMAESFLFGLDPSLCYERGIGRAVRQTNYSDCGIFLLMHAEYLSRNAPFTFTQEMMPDVRETVMRELLLKKLSAPVPKILPVSHSVNQTRIEVEMVSNESQSFESSDSYFCKIDNFPVQKKDLCTLPGINWPNDAVIHAYLNLIARRSKAYPDIFPSVFVFKSCFLKSISCGRSKSISPVRSKSISRKRSKSYPPDKSYPSSPGRSTKVEAVNILQSDLLLIPYHTGKHYSLLCVDNRRRTILQYDSSNGGMLVPNALNRVESFLLELGSSHPNAVPYPRPLQYKKGVGNAVKQTKSYDCGIYVLMHAEYLSRNAPFTFTQEMMPDVRETIVHDLLQQKLSAPLPEIIPLNHSPSSLVNDANIDRITEESLGSSGSDICKINDITVQIRDLNTLSGIRCLNDTVIDAYLNLIALRSKTYPDVFPSVYVFNSFFLKSILSGRCTKIKYHAADILQSNLLFIPYNPGEHWTLFCVDNRKRTITHYDPYLRKAGLELLCAIERFLLKLAALNPNCVPRPLEYQKGKEQSVVEWRNRYDCGVFLLLHVEYLSRNEPFSFTQESMPLFRHQITYEFLLQKLSAPFPLVIPSGFKEIVTFVDIGEIGGPYSTLTFNFDLQPIIVSSYMNLLQKQFKICVYPDKLSDSSTLLIPIKSERGWGLVSVEKHKQLVTYVNILPEIGKTSLLQNLDLDLHVSDFMHTELSFPNHSIDSGVFVLATSYCIAKNIPISPFNENHVSYLRTKIFLELL